MIRLLTFALMLLSLVTAQAQNTRLIKFKGFSRLWAPAVMNALDGGDVLVHWKMNEGPNTNRADSADSKTLVESGVVNYSTGILSNAAYFEGVAVSSSLGVDMIKPGDTDFSFSGWVKFFSATTNNVVLQRHHSSASSYTLESQGTFLRWGVSSSGTSIDTYVTSSVPIITTQWMFFVAYHDAGHDQIGISCNNETVVTKAHSGGVAAAAGIDFRVGVGYLEIDPNAYLNGLVDSVTYFKRVLSQQDIGRLYNGGLGLDYPFP